MRTEVLRLEAAAYRQHVLHVGERIWPLVNCHVDTWIEVLHALGFDPVPAAAVALATDFDGDQWTYLKFAPEDLRHLYGIEVAEIEVWRPLPDHIEEYLRRGRLLTVEVDAWFLPDTAGVAYRLAHRRTTVVPQMIDRAAQRMGYFHDGGYHELWGHDYLGVLRMERPAGLPPHVEVVRRTGEGLSASELVEAANRLARTYLARRPATNPMSRFGTRLQKDLPWLAEGGADLFHRYAFATCRQCGAAAELAAAFVRWLDAATSGRPATDAARLLDQLADDAKGLQFVLERAAAGRGVVVDGLLERMADAWDGAMTALDGHYERAAAHLTTG